MKAADIQKALDRYYMPISRYVVPNVYFFGHGYCETDCLIVKENGFIYDIEIKISRSDFKADFKKQDKHQIIQQGQTPCRGRYIQDPETGRYVIAGVGTLIPAERPNRFYYAVPERLIKISDLPSYAGLLYITPTGSVIKIKEAPLLHKEVVPHESRLCRKFYFPFKAVKLSQTEEDLHKRIAELEILLADKHKQLTTLSDAKNTTPNT